MKRKIIILLLLLVITPITYGQFRKAYVLSEGGFSANSSKLSLYNIQQNTFTLNIFSPGNLGLYPDGLILYQNYLYLLEQGGYGGQGKIYKLDSNGTVQNSRSFGTNPYSLTVANNKVYTTNGLAGKTIVLDLNSFSTIKEIQTGVFPQEIISLNDNVFICNVSLYGGNQDSTITVINSVNDSVIIKINLQKDPTSIAVSNDSNILTGCQGQNGKIYKIDSETFQVTNVYTLTSGFDKDISVDRNSGNVYYINYNNGISKLDLTTGQVTDIINNPNPSASYFYGYNYDYYSGRHYVVDAKNFIINGSMNIYNSAGNLELLHTTGIAPRRIVFKSPVTTSVKKITSVAGDYKLYQNYPNPFNPFTIIAFSVPGKDFVNLSVYDISGKIVTELLNRELSAGSYEVKFDAQNLASGVYYYILSGKNGILVKNMVILK